MLKAIYTYELTRLLRQPATYLYFGVFFAMALLSMLGTGGYFDAAPKPGKGLRLLNSPHEINFIFQYFNKFFLFLLPAIIGMTIYKDFKNQVYPLLYAFPIKKSDYLFGKFFSALTVVLVITLSAGIAFYLGERMLTRDNPIIGPTTLWGYASAYFFFVFPNMFLYGLLVFSVVAALRNPFAGFMAVLLLFLVQVATDNLFAGNPWPGALLEPFGQNAAAYETRYWTIAEQNVRQIPVWGIVLWNRILWAIISLVCFGLFYSKFQLEQETFRLLPNRAPKRKTAAGAFPHASSSGYHRPVARVDFSVRRQIQAMLQLSIVDFKYIIRSWLFHVMLLFGILALVFALSRVTNRGDLTFLPLTRIMLSIPMFFFSTVIMLLTFLYSGMLVHRAQMAKANQLIDATGTSNWVLLGSKILALLQVQVVLLCVLMMCGIGLQLYHGYYHLEIGLYLYHLFVLTFPTLMIWAVISLCTHTLAPNVYPGLFLLLLAWLGKEQLPEWGIESHLFRFNSPPQLVYSDLNGFGHGLLAVHLVNAYWLAFAGLAFVVAYLFWQRGNTYSFQERMEQAIQRFKGFVPPVAFLLCCLFCGLGLTIHQEENSPFQPADNQAQVLEQFRANFGAYAPVAQPKITSVKLTIDLFPETRSFTAAGAYWLVNRTTQNIDTLWIKTGYDEITAYALDAPSRLLREDKEMQVAVHVLETPLQPADSLRMRFDIKNKPTTLFYQNAAVLENGTFLRTDILPRLGYSFGQEAREPADRLSRYLNFYSQDADLVDIETTIRTNRLQTAIAPGHLQKQWKKNGSAYFHYRTKEKIKFAFAFNSGVYAIHKTQYRGVALEIYHHHKHDENIRDMQEGLKAALDYNTHYFGPYQHGEVRIVEFPLTGGSYASVMGNAIPTSEARFILKNRDVNDQVNLSFYVQAHELTHQWWGNQVVPADALGAKMLTESIAEYISLRIYERYFGQEKALHFLSLQRKRYLEGRTTETGKENPLYLVQPEQEYIAYGKGAMAFNTLAYYAGEEKLNGILKAFLQQYKFRTDLYPTTVDLIAYLKKSVAPEFHYIIRDMMESITFYDHQITGVKKLPANLLEITLAVKKLDQTLTRELEARQVFIPIGQYDSGGNLLHTDLCKVSSGEHTITLPRRPGATRIVLDPYLHFIELNRENNQRNVGVH